MKNDPYTKLRFYKRKLENEKENIYLKIIFFGLFEIV